jgi:heptosyltransferase-1
MDKFLIIRLSSLGDIIHTLPAFSALRSEFLDAHITWVVEEPGREILELVPGLDRIVAVRAKQWKWHTRSFRMELAQLRKDIRARDQVALDFQGLIKSGLIAWLSGAKKRIGFSGSDLREPAASLFYTQGAAKFQNHGHVIRKNLNLLQVLGIQQDNLVFPIVLPEALQTHVLEKLNFLGFDGRSKLVVVNVGAAWETKRWSAAKWIQMLKAMTTPGIFPVLLWGTEQERLLAQEITAGCQVPAVPFLPLKEVIALLQTAELVVSGDTFALQAACALARPVVGIFGPTDPERNGPFCKEDRFAFEPLECSYCYKRTCPNVICLEALNPEHVAELCLERLF